MLTDFHKFGDRIKFAAEASAGGSSILSLPIQTWKPMRSITAPAFTIAKVKKMQTLIEESIDDLVANLSEHVGEIVNVKDAMCGKRCLRLPRLHLEGLIKRRLGFSLDAIANVAFGTKVSVVFR